MNALPPGWVTAKIENVTEPFAAIDPRRNPERKFRYIDIGSIDNATQSITDPKSFCGAEAPSRARRIVQSGDTLFSTVRTYLKNVALVPADLDGELTSTGIAILRPSPALDHTYLFTWARSDEFISEMSVAQDGTMYPAVSDQDVKAARIPLPPLAEQRRIVGKIDSLSARSRRARDELDRIPRLVEKYRQAVLAAAFRGDLTREWRRNDATGCSAVRPSGNKQRGRNRQTHAAFCPPFGLPNTWSWLRLPELGEVARGKSRHRPRNDAQLFGGLYPFIQTGDVKLADRFVRSYSSTYNDLGLAQSRLWPKGTVCITIAANIAETAILDFAACFPDSVVGFVAADSERADPSYVEFFIRTARDELAAFAPATAQKNINLDTLDSTRIPVGPLEEQTEIVRRIEIAFAWIDRLAAETKSARKLIDRLDQAVLAKAFRGALVPQDPDDEPAGALLERIRAERAASPPPKRRGRRAAAAAG